MSSNHNSAQCAGIREFCRNRYVHGKLLDVYHFELEQNYFNAKRWLINRMVGGYGVVCGLDVQPGDDGCSVVVSPGLAIDKWGREMLVPQGATVPIPVSATTAPPPEPAEQMDCADDKYVHLCLCYHECLSNPVPVLGGCCDETEACTPGTICERYEFVLKNGKAPAVEIDCTVPDLVSGGRINYPALANYVSAPCPDCADDPCIPLANIELPDPSKPCCQEHIDIAVRPVVFTNDLVHDLLVCLTSKKNTQEYRGGKN